MDIIDTEEFRMILGIIYSAGENDGLRRALGKEQEGKEKALAQAYSFIDLLRNVEDIGGS